MNGDLVALTLFHCPKVGHLGPILPKMMSLLISSSSVDLVGFIFHIVLAVNSIQQQMVI